MSVYYSRKLPEKPTREALRRVSAWLLTGSLTVTGAFCLSGCNSNKQITCVIPRGSYEEEIPVNSLKEGIEYAKDQGSKEVSFHIPSKGTFTISDPTHIKDMDVYILGPENGMANICIDSSFEDTPFILENHGRIVLEDITISCPGLDTSQRESLEELHPFIDTIKGSEDTVACLFHVDSDYPCDILATSGTLLQECNLKNAMLVPLLKDDTNNVMISGSNVFSVLCRGNDLGTFNSESSTFSSLITENLQEVNISGTKINTAYIADGIEVVDIDHSIIVNCTLSNCPNASISGESGIGMLEIKEGSKTETKGSIILDTFVDNDCIAKFDGCYLDSCYFDKNADGSITKSSNPDSPEGINITVGGNETYTLPNGASAGFGNMEPPKTPQNAENEKGVYVSERKKPEPEPEFEL